MNEKNAISQKTKIIFNYFLPICIAYTSLYFVLLDIPSPPLDSPENPIWSTVILLFAGSLAQDIPPRGLKEAIVFWRVKNRLPSFRIIEQLHKYEDDLSDELIDKIKSINPPEAKLQNIFFRQNYQKISDDPSIYHASYRYLAWRDSCVFILSISISAIMMMTFIAKTKDPLNFIIIISSSVIFTLSSILCARNSAYRLIGLVLTHHKSEESANAS